MYLARISDRASGTLSRSARAGDEKRSVVSILLRNEIFDEELQEQGGNKLLGQDLEVALHLLHQGGGLQEFMAEGVIE